MVFSLGGTAGRSIERHKGRKAGRRKVATLQRAPTASGSKGELAEEKFEEFVDERKDGGGEEERAIADSQA